MEIWRPFEAEEPIPEERRMGELTLYSEEPSLSEVSAALDEVGVDDPDVADLQTLLSTEDGVNGQRNVRSTTVRPVDDRRSYEFSGPVGRFTPMPVEVIPQGVITVGEPMIGQLPNRLYPQKDYYGVLFPFTVEKPLRYNRYRSLDVDFTIWTQNAVVRDMYPREVEEERTIETEVTISPTLKFTSVELAGFEVSFMIPFEYVSPVITPSGHGTNNPRWTFRKGAATTGNKWVSFVLEVPSGMATVHGALRNRATVGGILTDTIKTDPFWFEFDLEEAPTLPIEPASVEASGN
ncbi:hypothetical protein [Salinilacihabitans rarus]|uniref:hypothetical protein n=1 Tax=Salinilacihabitans rarus TaxID=2961596 RepID=UPI0020C8FC51|nr:hypothetical protein [Salinilacihabitans rarus]